jgi:hypothetical protein
MLVNEEDFEHFVPNPKQIGFEPFVLVPEPLIPRVVQSQDKASHWVQNG